LPLHVWFLASHHFASFGSRIMSATAGEAPYVLDGLMLGADALPLHEHYTDTGGATDHVFGLCHLLGFRFVPRLRDIADRKLGSIAGAGGPRPACLGARPGICARRRRDRPCPRGSLMIWGRGPCAPP